MPMTATPRKSPLRALAEGAAEIVHEAMGDAGAAKVEVPWRRSSAYLMTKMEGFVDVVQAKTLRAIMDGLMQSGAVLEDKHPVKCPMDVFRWFLERAAEDMPADVWTEPIRK